MNNDIETYYAMTDRALLAHIGKFIKKTRLEQNKTQQALADFIGISRSTIIEIENGRGGTMLTFIQILRALQQLHKIDHFTPVLQVSPLLLAKLERQQRKRAARAAKVENNKKEPK